MSEKDEARKANADLRKLRLEVSLLVKMLQAGRTAQEIQNEIVAAGAFRMTQAVWKEEQERAEH